VQMSTDRGHGRATGMPLAASVAESRRDLAGKFAAGGLSCMIVSALLNFNDVIKVRLQTDSQLSTVAHTSRKYRGYFNTARVITAEEGLQTLFLRGMTPSMMRELSYSTLRMGLYEPVKNALAPNATGDIGLVKKIAAGMTSGAIGSALANPTDLIKIRFQASKELPYRSTMDAFRQIWAAEGLRGLYKGVGPTTLRASILTSAQLSSYDHTKHVLLERRLLSADGFALHFTASVVSGLVTTAASSPVDVIKTRIMSELARGAMFNSPLDCFVKSLQAEGLGVLYRGFLPNYMRLGPHFVLSLPLLEYLRNLFGVGYMK